MQVKAGHIAVVTGGGSGMGRELCLALGKHGQLNHRIQIGLVPSLMSPAAKGCHVALCDVNQDPLDETIALCNAAALNADQRFFGGLCDVGDEAACNGFAAAVKSAMGQNHINLLFK